MEVTCNAWQWALLHYEYIAHEKHCMWDTVWGPLNPPPFRDFRSLYGICLYTLTVAD